MSLLTQWSGPHSAKRTLVNLAPSLPFVIWLIHYPLLGFKENQSHDSHSGREFTPKKRAFVHSRHENWSICGLQSHWQGGGEPGARPWEYSAREEAPGGRLAEHAFPVWNNNGSPIGTKPEFERQDTRFTTPSTSSGSRIEMLSCQVKKDREVEVARLRKEHQTEGSRVEGH